MTIRVSRLEHCSTPRCRKVIPPQASCFLFNGCRYCLDCGAIELAKAFHFSYERQTLPREPMLWEQAPEKYRERMVLAAREILVKDAQI